MRDDIVIFGGLLLDRYFEVDRWPVRGQDGYIAGEDSYVGGCAINMAVTIENLGGKAHVASCVGNDRTGKSILEYMEEHALSQTLLSQVDGTTGSCLVFSEPDGERTFLTRMGLEERFTPELAERIRQLDLGYAGVTGYYLLGNDSEVILLCLEELHAAGVKILFDPSPLVGDISPAILRRMIAVSDVLTPNQTELSALGGDAVPVELAKQGKTIFLKKGEDGGTVFTGEGSFDYASVRCDAVDTTGAGDSFSGALLYAMSRELPLEEAVRLATICAAKTVQIHGPHGFWNLEE